MDYNNNNNNSTSNNRVNKGVIWRLRIKKHKDEVRIDLNKSNSNNIRCIFNELKVLGLEQEIIINVIEQCIGWI